MAGLWIIVVPEDGLNYITNPSFEKGLTNWSTFGSGHTVTQSHEWQKRGNYSMKVSDPSGSSNGRSHSSSSSDCADFEVGDYITISADIKVVSGECRVQVVATHTGGGSSQSVQQDFDTSYDGNTGRVSLTVGPLTSTIQSLVVSFVSGTTGVNEFYVDGAQLERKSYDTTYFDGEDKGCRWLGERKLSKSSRDGRVSNGGKRTNLSDLGYYVEDASQVGMPPVKLLVEKQPLLDGDLLRGYSIPSRSPQLPVTNTPSSLSDLHNKRRALIDILKPDSGSNQRPLKLIYTGSNTELQLEVVYDSGLELTVLDGFSETNPIRFIAADPYWYEDGNVASALVESQSLSADYAVSKEEGVWSSMGSGFTGGAPQTWLKRENGKIVVGGNFTSVGGVANTAYLAEWDPETSSWSSIGTVNGTIVYGLAEDAEGNLYVAGNFTDINSVANASNFVKYDQGTSSWVSITPSGSPNALCVDVIVRQNGDIVVTGAFTSINGLAHSGISSYDGSSWSNFGTGLNNRGKCLANAANGNLYVGGEFTTADGVTVNRIAEWNGTTFVDLDSGVSGGDADVEDIVVASDGQLYVGGQFTSAGGQTVNYIARWNGIRWYDLNNGLDNIVSSLSLDEEDNVYVTGDFDADSDQTINFGWGVAVWNGYIWVSLDSVSQSTVVIFSSLALNFDYIYIGSQSTAVDTSEITTVSNEGTASVDPIIEITRTGGDSAIIRWIRNQTTDKILFLYYELQDGETLTIDLTPGQKSVVSSLFGSVWKAVLQTSNVSEFKVVSGNNDISFFVETSGSPTVDTFIRFTRKYWSLDGSDV